MESFFPDAVTISIPRTTCPRRSRTARVAWRRRFCESRTDHVQHQRMRTTRLLVFRSSGATNRFWLFASTTFDHKLKELVPQLLVLRNKNGTFCGERFFGFVTSKNKKRIFCVARIAETFVALWSDALWPGTFCDGSFCGPESHCIRCGLAPFCHLIFVAPFTSGRKCGHVRKNCGEAGLVAALYYCPALRISIF